MAPTLSALSLAEERSGEAEWLGGRLSGESNSESPLRLTGRPARGECRLSVVVRLTGRPEAAAEGLVLTAPAADVKEPHGSEACGAAAGNRAGWVRPGPAAVLLHQTSAETTGRGLTGLTVNAIQGTCANMVGRSWAIFTQLTELFLFSAGCHFPFPPRSPRHLPSPAPRPPLPCPCPKPPFPVTLMSADCSRSFLAMRSLCWSSSRCCSAFSSASTSARVTCEEGTTGCEVHRHRVDFWTAPKHSGQCDHIWSLTVASVAQASASRC